MSQWALGPIAGIMGAVKFFLKSQLGVVSPIMGLMGQVSAGRRVELLLLNRYCKEGQSRSLAPINNWGSCSRGLMGGLFLR